MKSLVNQQWIGLSGEPVTGRIPPRLLVMNGVEPTPGQMGLIAHHYKLLTYALHTAVVPYMVQERTLVDGTRIRMVSNYGTDTVMVWPVGGATKQIANRGFIADPTALTLKDPVDWAAERYTATYTYKDFNPILMKLNKARNGWEVRTKKFMHGVATNYSVMHTPARLNIQAGKWGPNDFFDVAYITNNALTISWTDKRFGAVRTVVLKDLKATGSVPIVFPLTGKRPKPSLPDGEQLHLYLLAPGGVKHIGGKDGLVAGTYDADAAAASLPIASDRIGPPCFGYDQATERANFFRTHAIFVGGNSDYAFLFYWHAAVKLLRTAPFLEVAAVSPVPVPSRQYVKAFDVIAGAQTMTTQIEQPSEYKMPSPGVLADIFVHTRIQTRGPDEESGWTWVYAVEVGSYGGEVMAQTPHVTGRTHQYQFSNSIAPYDESYTVWTQRGAATLRHTANVSVSYETSDSTAEISYYTSGLAAGYWGVDWPGILGSKDNPDESPYTPFGTSAKFKKNNNAATTVRYAIDNVDLFTLDASLSFTFDSGSATQYSYTPRLREQMIDELGTGAEYMLPPSGPFGPRVSYISFAFSDFATRNETTSPWSQPFVQDSTIHIKTRDYIYHDMVNDVAVYLKATGHAQSHFVDDVISGQSSWVMEIVVEAGGSSVTIPVASSTGGPTNSLIQRVDVIFGGGQGNPHIMYPLENPAIYAPVCEQGDFKYIAYTTKAEEAAGVPHQFILSLPLHIGRRNATILLDPEPPAHCYPFTAYNLSEASIVLPSATFSKLLGRAFQINITQGADRDWIVDLKVDDPKTLPPDNHYALCYRI